MWRRPVGRAGSGPGNRGTFRIQTSDYDPRDLPGCKVVGGRQLSQEFIDGMEEARKVSPPSVNFVEQMRERKRNHGTTGGQPTAHGPQEAADGADASAEGP